MAVVDGNGSPVLEYSYSAIIMNNVQLILNKDEAIVLFELLSDLDSRKMLIKHSSEEVVLQNIASDLEKALTEPFLPNYKELLDGARSRVGG